MIFSVLHFPVAVIFVEKNPGISYIRLIKYILRHFVEHFCEFGETEWAT